MTWLFAQLWFLLLLAYLAGAAVAWLTITAVLPSADTVRDVTDEGAA